MFNAGSLLRAGPRPFWVLVLVAGMLSGCSSKQDRALDQAKKQAGATGQAQQSGFCRQEWLCCANIPSEL